MMRLLCKIFVGLFGFAYLAALALLAISYWSLFGAERDPLSGVFLIPLGLPWNLALEWAPNHLQLAIGIFAPLLNFIFLLGGYRLLRKADGTRNDHPTS